ncbi:uncharacterized protein LOC134440509 isoform X1 [Engraulis encrasicolus]|uniref:uncharacterized protein LOC134440509 isoform X1 n=1 Tax=Engraulis encrasicolus TaxID=184585 RepID=UPI002FD15BC4
MRTAAIASLLLILAAEATCEIQVKSFLGGGLLVKCKFDDKYKNHIKYFCKAEDKTTCPFERYGKAVDERYTERNVRDDGYYIVVIKQLTLSDATNYGCAVENEEDAYIKVTITIKEGECCQGPLTIPAAVGQPVDIPCKYPRESRDNGKVFCTQDIISVTCYGLSESRTRFSMTDDNHRLTFMVHINNVTSRDLQKTVFWCGVRTGGNTGSVALLTEVHLKEQDTDTSSPSPPELPLIMGVCLTLFVLLVAIAVFLFAKRQHRRTSRHAAGSYSPASKTSANKIKPADRPVASGEGEYEEIKDTARPPQPSTPHTVTFTDDPADLQNDFREPDNLCADGPAYAAVQFVKNPAGQERTNESSSAELQGEEQACEYASVKYIEAE